MSVGGIGSNNSGGTTGVFLSFVGSSGLDVEGCGTVELMTHRMTYSECQRHVVLWNWGPSGRMEGRKEGG